MNRMIKILSKNWKKTVTIKVNSHHEQKTNRMIYRHLTITLLFDVAFDVARSEK